LLQGEQYFLQKYAYLSKNRLLEKKRKMKTINKFAIALLAVFLVSVVASVPMSYADEPARMKTYAISDAIPNVVGVGDSVLLKCGITEALASADYGWSGLKIKVVAPDGKTTELGPFKTDSTGSTYANFVPDQIGTYTITTIFPEQTMPVDTMVMERGGMTIRAGTIMLASNATSTFTVTEEPRQYYPGHSLPSEYWSRPIDPQLREWYSISGNWVARPDNSVALYNDDAPETAHVLWARELTTGGLAGGLWGPGQVPAASETGDAYEGKFSGSIILNGVLYYNEHDQGLADSIHAVDLHTGEELWVKEGVSVAFGQVFYFDSYNYDGVFTYLYTTSGSTYSAWDPYDGKWCFNFTNVPSGTRVYGPSGEILIYTINTNTNRMMLWNSTLCGLQNAPVGTSGRGSWGSNVQGRSLPANTPACYSWNVSIPAGLQQSSSFFTPILKVYNEDRVVSVFFNQTHVRVWALDISNLNAESTQATKLFDKWWNAPSEWLEGSNTIHYVGATNYVNDPVYGEGVIGVWSKELTTHYGFSVKDGRYLWATASEHYLDAYGWGNAEHTWYYAYGKLYSVGVAGILYAYDLKTGATEWTYNLTDAYGEPVTGQNWWGWITLIADGKIYIGTCEHSAENPLPRGAPQACVNATDGSEIWRINGMFRNTRWGGNGIIGDSIIATMDTYDQRVYAIGKGPSKTTVSVGPKVTTEGGSVIIEGTVMDVSPGTSTSAMSLRFPSGVAAVSDESMSDWMLYVYKQFECPANATGVPVVINVIDANGNFRTIGTATSDSSGYYSFNWTPDIPGKYTVIATFAGSKAYFGSYAETSFAVDQAAATPTPVPTQPPSAADLYFVPAIIGVIIAIIVVGAVLALLVTKKP